MSTYAIVENGVVINIVILGDDSEGWQPPEGCISVLSDVAQIGWLYADGEFTAPEPEIPAPDLAMLAIIARGRRDRELVDIYDRGVSMVQREIRRTHDNADRLEYLNGKLEELDEYAIELQGVPEQAGFPLTITWPTQPTE